MTRKTEESAGWLQIRPRPGLADDRRALSDGVVFCPFQGETLDLDDCRACEHCDGIALDATGRDSRLFCTRPMSEAAEPFRRAAPSRAEPAAGAAGEANVFATPVGDLMVRTVMTVSRDLSIEELTSLFLERGLSGAPVIDDDRHPLGLVTKTDLVRAYAGVRGEEVEEPIEVRLYDDLIELGPGFHVESATGLTVGDIMTPITFSVGPQTTVAHAAALMSYEGVHRLPVVDQINRVVGIVSALDVMRWIAEADGYKIPGYTQTQRSSG